MNKSDSRKLIERASAAVRKRYGDNVPSERASVDLVALEDSVFVSTGSLALDRAIAGRIPGGIPVGPKRGRVVHIFGDPSLGKTLLLDMLLMGCQVIKGLGLVSEVEGSRDPHFAKAIGLDLSLVEIQRPRTVEELFDAGLDFIADVRKSDSDIPILWGWDSLELVEAGKTFGDRMSESGSFHYGGGRAEAIGAGCRKVAVECSRHPTTFVILNQIRENVGVMFGAAKKPPGGHAARFFASVEVQLSSSKLGRVEQKGRVTARWVHAKIVKNKIAAPFAECDFLIDFHKGVRRWSGLAEMLDREEIISAKKDQKGRVVGDEFIVTATGECLPLKEFTAWCEREKVLEK